jgi:hypothetical protein
MKTISTLISFAITSLAIAPFASAQLPCITCAPTGHLGVAMKVIDDKIRTGVYQYDPINPVTVDVGQRVWAAFFRENPFDPFYTDLPCYGATTDSGLPPDSKVGFNIRADLLYWDGTGTVSFVPVPCNEQLQIKYGFQSRFAGTDTGFVTGFNFQTVPSDGSFHRHLSYFLLGADGNAAPADIDGIQATDGIYLLQLELTSTAGIAASDPIWIVFRNFPSDRLDAPSIHCMALNHAAHRMAFDRAAADVDFDRDVDADDIRYLQVCITGPQVPWTDSCCEWADLDTDGDVDMIDFSLFQRCFAGPDNTANLDCAD